MDNRYSHPEVGVRFTPEWNYETWLLVELLAVKHSSLIPRKDRDEMSKVLGRLQIDERAISDIRIQEAKTNHEVVAFLNWMRGKAPGNTGRWVHYGLTSSDVIDTTQAFRFRCIEDQYAQVLAEMWAALDRWTVDNRVVLGRTHGQAAEPTSLRVRAMHWKANLMSAAEAVMLHCERLQKAKMSGPVGTFAHNPPEFEAAVAGDLGLRPLGTGASQIAPRAELALWASAAAVFAAACAKVAMDTRLMNLLGEADEMKNEGEVGSSAMAHKRNPIIAEQLTGMQRVMAGYASMLQPLDLWLERDISNSSVERIAVPAIWHLLFHVARQTTKLLNVLKIDLIAARYNMEADANGAWTSYNTNQEIRAGLSVEDARAYALESQIESYDIEGDAKRDFLWRYPR